MSGLFWTNRFRSYTHSYHYTVGLKMFLILWSSFCGKSGFRVYCRKWFTRPKTFVCKTLLSLQWIWGAYCPALVRSKPQKRSMGCSEHNYGKYFECQNTKNMPKTFFRNYSIGEKGGLIEKFWTFSLQSPRLLDREYKTFLLSCHTWYGYRMR